MQGNEYIKEYLEDKGYKINDKAFNRIKIASDWYCNKTMPFHQRTTINGVDYQLKKSNFTKRLCSDDANLCETVEIVAQKSDSNNDIINKVLKKNNFNVMYRQQLEEMSATGTVGCYFRIKDAKLLTNGDLKGGDFHINYASADNIVILSCDNNEIEECAFYGDSYDIKGSKSAIVMFTLDEKKKNYICTTIYFDENHEKLKEETIKLNEVKPFAIMRVAEVNNYKDMKGYGLPKIFNVVAELELFDLVYNLWYRDLDKSDKLVLINKALCKWDEVKQQYVYPNEEMKKIFVSMQEGKDSEHGMYQEYNPDIRIDAVVKCMELVLSMLSMRFGYGSKKYTFDNGKIVTATEYIGERQDAMQELNKQRNESRQYIEGIIKYIRYYELKFNHITLPDDDISIKFDDSYVIDSEKEMEIMRNDALTFQIPQLLKKYLQKKYTLTDEEVEEWLKSVINTDGTSNEE